jgi:hypothetical protein
LFSVVETVLLTKPELRDPITWYTDEPPQWFMSICAMARLSSGLSAARMTVIATYIHQIATQLYDWWGTQVPEQLQEAMVLGK